MSDPKQSTRSACKRSASPWDRSSLDRLVRQAGGLERVLARRALLQSGQAIESLEPRRLLSGSHDDALLDAINAALRPGAGGEQNVLAKFTQRLADDSQFGQALPIISDALAGQLDLQGEIESLTSRLSSATPSFTDLRNNLEGAGGLADGLTVLDARNLPDRIEYDLSLEREFSEQVNLNVDLPQLDFNLAGNLMLGLDLRANVTVGAFWNGTAPVFFLRVGADAFTLEGSVSASNLTTSTGVLGFANISLSAGAFSLSPQFSAGLNDPGVSSGEDPGELTAGELLGGSIGSLASTDLSAGTDGVDIAFDVTSSVLPEAARLEFTWSDITDPASVDWNLPSLPTLESISSITEGLVRGGLSDWSAFMPALADAAALGRDLPVIGDKLGEIADIATWFNTRFVNQLQGFSTVNTLLQRLNQLAGVSGAGAEMVDGSLLVSADLATSWNKIIPIDLPLDDFGLQVDADVQATAALSGALRFGVDLDTGEFFIDTSQEDELQVDVTVSATSIDASARVGFVAAELTDGTASLTASAGIDFVDPDDAGKLLLPEITAADPKTDLLSMSFSGSATAALPLAAPALGFAEQVLSVDWSDVSDPTTFTANLPDFDIFDTFQDITVEDFSVGLIRIANLLATMVERPTLDAGGTIPNPLHEKLPLIDRSLSDLVNLHEFLETLLVDPTEITFDDGGTPQIPFADTDQLLAVLEQIVADAAGSSVVNFNVDTSALRYTLDLDLANLVNESYDLALATDAGVLDLTLAGDVDFDLDTRLLISFGVTSDGTFFITDNSEAPLPDSSDPTPHFAMSGSASVTGSAGAQLGFLDLDLVGAGGGLASDISLGASARLDDPATVADDGRITLNLASLANEDPADDNNELDTANIDQILDIGTSGSVELTATFNATVGGTDLLDSPGDVVFSWLDAFAGSDPAIDTSGIEDLLDWQNLNAGDVFDGLQSIPFLLETIIGVGGLGRDLPVVGGAIGEAIDFVDAFKDDLENNVDFTSIQTMADSLGTALSAWLNVPVSVLVDHDPSDPTSQMAVFISLALNYSPNPLTTQFNVSEGIDAGSSTVLGFSASGDITADPAADLNLSVGLDLRDGVPLDRRVFIDPAGTNAAVNFKGSASVSGNATFGILSAGISGGTVGIGASDGSGGVDSADNAAITLGLQDPDGNGAGDGRITLDELVPAHLPDVIATPTITGAAQINLPLNLPGASSPLPVVITWADLADPGTFSTAGTADFSDYLDDLTSFDLSTVLAGLQDLIDMIGGWAEVDLLNENIPFIDKSVNDLFDYAQDILAFFNNVRSETQSGGDAQAFDNALTTEAGNFGTITLTPDGDNNIDPLQGPFQLEYTLEVDLSKPLNFDESLSVLDILTLDAGFDITAGFNLTMDFGLNPDHGFYLQDSGTAAGPEMTLGLSADVDLAAEGNIGPLTFGVLKDDVADNLVLNAGFTVDLVDPQGSDGIITAAELAGNLSSVFKPEVGAEANLFLPLGLLLGSTPGVDPGVTADFRARWDSDQPGKIYFGETGNSTGPADGFTNIRIEVGEAVRRIVGPIIETINKYNPIPQEVLDFVTDELPLVGVTPLEMLEKTYDIPEGVTMLIEILSVINDVEAVINSGSTVDLSGFSGFESFSPSDFGPHATTTPSGDTWGGGEGSASGDDTSGAAGIFDGLKDTLDGFGLSVPLLTDPAGTVIDIFLQNPVDLVVWDPEQWDLTVDYSQTVPLWGVGVPPIASATINAYFRVGFSLFGDLEIGLTTRGLLAADWDGDGIDDNPNLLAGFFFGDNYDEGGEDRFEVGFNAFVEAGISGTVTLLGFDLVELGGGGGVSGTIGLDLADIETDGSDMELPVYVLDPNTGTEVVNRVGRTDSPRAHTDGRVYLNEIGLLLDAGYGPECVATLGGMLDVYLRVFGKVNPPLLPAFTVFDETLSYRLLDWELPCHLETANLADLDPATGTLEMLSDSTAGTGDEVNVDVQLIRERQADPATGVRAPVGVRIDKSYRTGDNRGRISEFFELNEDGTLTDLGDPGAGESGDVTGPFDTLIVRGTAGDDSIWVDPAIQEELGLDVIRVYAGAGDDLIDMARDEESVPASPAQTWLHGEDGDDTITGTYGPDRIEGGEGDDVLGGGDGDDTLIGGAGRDRLGGDAGDDSLDGGAGSDVLDGDAGNDTLIGSDGDDTLSGGDGHDSMSGGLGEDVARGGAGNDALLGGDGADELDGGTGDDVIDGGAQDDIITAGAGDDSIAGGDGDDTIGGGAGNDTIFGNAGADEITASSGDNYIDAGSGSDKVTTGFGHDTVLGGSGHDLISTAGGHNRLFGDAGDDTLLSGSGADRIDAGAGFDSVVSGAGDDVIHLGPDNAADEVDAGAGVDAVIRTVSGTAGLSDWSRTGLRLALDGGAAAPYIGVESLTLAGDGSGNLFDLTGFTRPGLSIVGGNGLDEVRVAGQKLSISDREVRRGDGWSASLDGVEQARLTGTSRGDTFDVTGFTGTTTLAGGAGDDTVLASAAGSKAPQDWVLSSSELSRNGAGVVSLSDIGAATLTGGDAGDTLDASAFTGRASLVGNAGNDTLNGGSGPDVLEGGYGTDSLLGHDGADLLDAGKGDNEFLDGGAGDDTLLGSDDGNETLFGGPGNDRLEGRAGNDTLRGGSGDDTLGGGPGDDLLEGEAGADLLLGGTGHDDLYGHNQGGTDDDSAVDELYGEAGTDRLFGNGGNDVMFGGADDDAYNRGGGSFAGHLTDEADDPPGFNPGDPTPPVSPDATPATPSTLGDTLADGPEVTGRWTAVGGSDRLGGLAGVGSDAGEIVVATSGSTRFAAFVDNRTGRDQVYVARHTDGGGWIDLLPSESAGMSGLYGATAEASSPTLAVDGNGDLLVAWQEAGGNVRAARYDVSGDAWEDLGVAGTGTEPQIVVHDGQPVLFYVTGGDVQARRYDGGWSDLPGGPAADRSAPITQFSVGSDGTNLAIGYTSDPGGGNEVYLRNYTGGAWSGAGGSDGANGLSDAAGSAEAATVAWRSGELFVAYAQTPATPDASLPVTTQVHVQRLSSGAWTNLGAVSSSRGAAADPSLAANGTSLHLVWREDVADAGTGDAQAIFAKKYEGSAFVEAVAGDARLSGITGDVGALGALSVAVDTTGSPFVAFESSSRGSSDVVVLADQFATNRVFYVNDGSLSNDSLTTSVGDDANDGLSPAAPKRTLAGLPSLSPGDVVVLDTGTYGSATFGSDYSGVLVVGAGAAPTGFSSVSVSGNDVALQNVQTGSLSVSGDNAAIDGVTANTLNLTGGSGSTVARSTVSAATTVSSGVSALTLVDIAAGGPVTVEGGTDLRLVDNTFTGGLTFAGSTSVSEVRRNRIGAPSTALSISADVTGPIEENIIRNSARGVEYDAAASLWNNRITGNSVGVRVAAGMTSDGLGLVGTGLPNIIEGNTTGVDLQGRMVQQIVRGNATAVVGSGELGPAADDDGGGVGEGAGTGKLNGSVTGSGGSGGGREVKPTSRGAASRGSLKTSFGSDLASSAAVTGLAGENIIEGNAVGASFTGTIRLNRFIANETAILASPGQRIVQNVFDRNSVRAVDASGAADVRIVNNTFYSDRGDNVVFRSGSTDGEVLGNILWVEGDGKADIRVDASSRIGFFSDYNLLHKTGSAILVDYAVEFSDILDWQQDVYAFDLHSVGTTTVNPHWSNPQFVDRNRGDLAVNDMGDGVAGRRFSSPAVDAGHPLAELGRPASIANLLTNAGFEGGTGGWSVNSGGGIRSASPAAFEGEDYFFAGNAQNGFAEQTVDLLASGYSEAQLDSLDFVATFGSRIRSFDQSPPDRGQLTIRFLDAGDGLLSESTIVAGSTRDRWELLGGRERLPAGTRSIQYRFEATRVTGTANDAYLDAAFLAVTPDTALADAGVTGNGGGDIAATSPRVALRSPDLYTDWELGRPQTIRWESFANTADHSVRVEVWQEGADGADYLVTLTNPVTDDDGSFTFTPQNFAELAHGMQGLRVQVALVDSSGNVVTFDRSAEPLAITEDTADFYVNDRSTAGDEHTTGIGSNRNSGRLPSAPKPLLTTLLRTYDLDAGDTVYVDTGDYLHFRDVLLSGEVGVGDDEAIAIIGPTATDVTAAMHPLERSARAVIELDDADFVTIENLTLSGAQRGLWVHNDSDDFSADNLTVYDNDGSGILLDNTAQDAVLGAIRSYDNAGHGVDVQTPIDSLSDGYFYNNGLHGIRLQNAGNTVVSGNRVYDNTRHGIEISTGGGSPLVGTLDVNAGGGNVVRDNGFNGIYVSGGGNPVIGGNVVSGHTAGNREGIYANNGVIRENVVFDNARGIEGSNASIEFNRIHGNNQAAYVTHYSHLIGNVVYANNVGIDTWRLRIRSGEKPEIRGNLIYDNGSYGLRVRDGADPQIENNTILARSGVGLVVQDGTANARLWNNVLLAEAAASAAVSISPNSQSGFASDYNLLHAQDGAAVGIWQNLPRTDINAWRNAAFDDASSLSADPLYVDRDGDDDVLGTNDDQFIPQSEHGSNKGATRAPLIAPGDLLPSYPATTLSNDAAQSPVIDRGDPTYPVGSEVNGGNVINLGHLGGTALASQSPSEYVIIVRPQDSDTWPANQSFSIRWIGNDLGSGDVEIDLLRDSDAGYLYEISSTETNDGEFLWTVPNDPSLVPPGNDYRVRVTRNGTGANGTSDTFSVVEPISIYYVNDDTLTGDVFTTAVGDNANDGLSPSTPKASLRALLDTYDLGPGDVVRVDTGRYSLGTNVIVSANDSGVVIEGPSGTIEAGEEYEQIILDDGADGYWRLGEADSSDPAADSAGSADGVFMGSPTVGVPGVFGSFGGTTAPTAVEFDGVEDHVAMGDIHDIGTAGLTLEAWIKPEASNGGNDGFIVSRFAPGESSNQYALYMWNNRLGFALTTTSGTYATHAGPDLTDGQWHHVAGTYDDGVMRWYVDGQETISRTSLSGNVAQMSGGQFNIGRSEASTGRFFAGAVQEVAVYDEALAAGEIMERYTRGRYPTKRAVLDRGNTSAGSYAIELQDADDVLIRGLGLTGGQWGLYASSGSDSDDVHLEDNAFFGNSTGGVLLLGGNDDAVIRNNLAWGIADGVSGNDQSDAGFRLEGARAVIEQNEAFNNYWGFELTGADQEIRDNLARENRNRGIHATGARTLVETNIALGNAGEGFYLGHSGSSFNDALIGRENLAYSNSRNGFYVIYRSILEDSQAWGQTGSNYAGIRLQSGAVARNNETWGNWDGIALYHDAIAEGNRVYGNSDDGIDGRTNSGNAIGNIVYSNGNDGIAFFRADGNDRLDHNLVYDNGGYGIHLTDTRTTNGGFTLEFNTVYQPAGVGQGGILVDASSAGVTLRNNLVDVGQGPAINVAADSQSGFASDYNLIHLRDSAVFGQWQNLDIPDKRTWFSLLDFDLHTQTGNPLFGDIDGPDNQLGYVGGTDFGEDDTFTPQPGSPAIDNGALASFSYLEPAPMGGRADIGHLGQSPDAVASDDPLVQMLTPNGLEKYVEGETVPVTWRSHDLGLENPVLLANANGGVVHGVGGPLFANGDGFLTSSSSTTSWDGPFDTSGEPLAAPEALYRTARFINGAANRLSYGLPVPDGTYTLRLHFAYSGLTAGQRRFDIITTDGSGTTTQVSNFDPGAQIAGGDGVIVIDVPDLVAASGDGLSFELANTQFNGAFLNGFELVQVDPSGLADPTFGLEVSFDNGGSWAPLGSGLSVDRFGRGSFDWDVTGSGSQTLLRVSSEQTAAADVSDEVFDVSPGGNAFYINDDATSTDVYTSAPGNDANNGKTPSTPMRSLSALLAAYDLGPDDTIYIDAGRYPLISNVVIGASDAGVRIVGAGGADIAGTNYADEVLADAPQGYWRLGETSVGEGAGDATGNSSDGVYHGSPLLGEPGLFSNYNGTSDTAVEFDGVDNWVELGDVADVTGENLTVEAWIKPEVSNGGNNGWIAVRNLHGGNTQYGLYLWNNRLGFSLTSTQGSYANSAGPALNDGRWHHVAGTYDGTSMRWYVDGEQIFTRPRSGNVVSQPGSGVAIGRRLGDSGRFYDGLIQEVAIHDATLSSAALTERYLAATSSMPLTLLDRGNVVDGAYGLQLLNADDTEIDGIGFTGGDWGLVANGTSENVTVRNSFFLANRRGGLSVAGAGALVENNEAWGIRGNGNSDDDDQDTGIRVLGNGSTLLNNTAFGNDIDGIVVSADDVLVHDSLAYGNGTYGVEVVGLRNVVDTLETFGNRYGLLVDSNNASEANRSVARNVFAHDNTDRGAHIRENSLIEQSVFTGHSGSGDEGLYIASGAVVRDSEIFGNWFGVTGQHDPFIESNRVFNNSAHGLNVSLGGATASFNQVYSNGGDGIYVNDGAAVNSVDHNLIYDNGGWAIRLFDTATNALPVEFNTILVNRTGAAGALRTEGGGQGSVFRNNILDVRQGVAIDVADDSQRGFASDYNLLWVAPSADGVGRWQGKTFADATAWRYGTGRDMNSVAADPQFVDIDGADDILGYAGGTDGGDDDDFSVSPSSPTLNAGDPASLVIDEGIGGDGRANIGHLGQTPEAISATDGGITLERTLVDRKIEVGQNVPILFQAAGLGGDVALAQLNLAGGDAGAFSGDWSRFFTDGSNSTNGSVDLTGVDRPAPPSVYQTYRYANGSNSQLTGQFDVPDGSYTLRLHFAFNGLSAGGRRFDVDVNGTTEVASYDPGAVIDGGDGVAILELDGMTASAGDGLLLELVNTQFSGAFLSGIEVIREDAIPAPEVDILVSGDGGANWTTLASDLATDYLSRGRFDWRAGDGLGDAPTDDALIRVVDADTGSVIGQSESFQVAPEGDVFYVNDNATADDAFTTAVGNNANQGKSPDQPMADLGALLRLYEFEPGDIIHLDAGSYDVIDNLRLDHRHSGITVRGAGRELSVLDRENVHAQRWVFGLQGATDITLENLGITGAERGIVAVSNGESDRLVVDNLDVFGNELSGVYIGQKVDDVEIRNSLFRGLVGDADDTDDQDRGIEVNRGHDVTIENNDLRDHDIHGIDLYGNRAQVTGNTVTNSGTDGIFHRVLTSGVTNRGLVEGNTVSNSGRQGIDAGSGSDVIGNTVFNNGTEGIYAHSGAYVAENVVFRNVDGIYASSSASIIGNRVFGNTDDGIYIQFGNVLVSGNSVYSNAQGIESWRSGNGTRISDNLVYANTEDGIVLRNANAGTGTVRVTNNTVHQPAGRAINVRESSEDVRLANNILWIGAGSALLVDSNSTTSFSSDHNLFFQNVPIQGENVRFAGTTYDTLADWQASGLGFDANSREGDPHFVDIDGADNILGYDASGSDLIGGVGTDNGPDDNFYVRRNSPAIDAGHTWVATDADLFGSQRRDDPSTTDAGGDRYVATVDATPWAATGTAQNWRSSTGANWVYNLPFDFPYFEESHSELRISANGTIGIGGFTSPNNDGNNDPAELVKYNFIAALWDNIRTSGTDDDIWIDEIDSDADDLTDAVKIAWDATHDVTGGDVKFSATLFADGRIQLNFGEGAGVNEDLTPTIGLGRAGGEWSEALPPDGAENLAADDGVMVDVVPGIIDIGALEFGGDSDDDTPPTLTATIPGEIFSGGQIDLPDAPSSITLEFSEPVNRIDAAAPAAYELRAAGADELFGTSDDIVYEVLPDYASGSTEVALDIEAGALPLGQYRVTVLSNASGNSGIHDTAGNLLDGDNDGVAGGDLVKYFDVVEVPPGVTTVTIADGADQRSMVQSIEVVFDKPVTPDADTFTLLQIKDGDDNPVSNDITGFTWTNPSGDGMSWILRFPTDAGFTGASLADGVYTLSVTIEGETSDVATFHRLFGDGDGDGDVDFFDFLKLRASYGQSSGDSGFNADFDGDDDGDVDFFDFLKFRANYSKSLTY